MAIPFVLAGTLTNALVGALFLMRRAGRFLHIAAGGVMIVMAAMATGQLIWFAFWLLERFPAFGSIG